MERRNQVEQGKHPSFAQGVRNQARDEQLLILLSILSLIVIRTPPDFFRMSTSGLEYGEGEYWIRPDARYWFKVASASLAKIGLILWGREVTGALPSGTEFSASGNNNQTPSWIWKKRQQNR